MFHVKTQKIQIIFSDKGVLEAIFCDGENITAHSSKSWFCVTVDGTEYQNNADYIFKTAQQTPTEMILQYTFLGEIEITHHFRVEGECVRVTAEINCVSTKQRMFQALTYVWHRLYFDGADKDCFYAPAQGACFEVTSQNINFRQGCAVKELSCFKTEEDMFSTTPDKGPGLLVLAKHDCSNAFGAFAWSERENIFPMICADSFGTDFLHKHMVCFEMSKFGSMKIGDTYLTAGSYHEILQAYKAFICAKVMPPVIPQWAEEGAVLEVHASQLGGFEKASQQLERFKEMGVSAIYLMPCLEYMNHMESGSYIQGYRDSGGPYSVLDYFKIAPDLGGEKAFHKFVEQAHSHNIRILFDLVPQGASVYGTLYKEKPNWFSRDENGQLYSSHGWNNTYSLDWSNPEVQQFFVDIACHYVKNFNIDGFRIDAPHWKEPNMADNLLYHASFSCFGSLEIIRRILEECQKIKPDIFLMNEVWGQCFTGITHAQCEYNISWMLYSAATGQYRGQDVQRWLHDYAYTQAEHSKKVVFMETHDTRLLTPVAERLRGAKVIKALYTLSIFMGYLPMVWYDELEDLEQFYKGLFRLRRQVLSRLACDVVLDKIHAESEDVFMGLRKGTEPMIFALNLNRAMVRTSIILDEDCEISLPEGKCQIFDLQKQAPMILYRNAGNKIQSYTAFDASEFKDVRLNLDPFQSYWLEIRPEKIVINEVKE